MSFWTNFKTLVELMFFQYLLRTVVGIIVEKNYYFYYKLPTEITADNTTENFFLLQCPYRATLEIPLLKEMSMCRIVARYGEATAQIPKLAEAALPRSQFRHTFVTYRVNSPSTNTISATAPHKVNIKPMPLTEVHPIVFMPKTARKPRDDHESILLESTPTSLKFLGVGSTIDKLFKDKTTAIDNVHDDNINGHSEKQRIFTKHAKFKKGEKSKGFQNMYYRDEIFNDRIFYDDVDQNGNYHMHEKKEEFIDNK